VSQPAEPEEEEAPEQDFWILLGLLCVAAGAVAAVIGWKNRT